MSFNINKLYAFSVNAIKKFSKEHPDETFYGFAIDADLLCLNSEEAFSNTLKSYVADWDDESGPNPYLNPVEISDLRDNTGDWAYQGFAELLKENGFDYDDYQDHYDEPDENSPYALAMLSLIKELEETNVFKSLKTTPDFSIKLMGHNY
jgi:hypothetical protein